MLIPGSACGAPSAAGLGQTAPATERLSPCSASIFHHTGRGLPGPHHLLPCLPLPVFPFSDQPQPENLTGYIVAGVVSGLVLLALIFGVVLYSRCPRWALRGSGGARGGYQ